MAGRLQAQMAPGQSPIHRAVDAIAGGGIIADRALPHAHVDHARLGGSQRNRAHRRPAEEPVRQVAPGDTRVGRAPDTTAGRAEVEGGALPGMTRNCHYPPATVRPDQTPRQLIQESAHRDTVARSRQVQPLRSDVRHPASQPFASTRVAGGVLAGPSVRITCLATITNGAVRLSSLCNPLRDRSPRSGAGLAVARTGWSRPGLFGWLGVGQGECGVGRRRIGDLDPGQPRPSSAHDRG